MVETQTKNQNIFWFWSDKVDWEKRGDVFYWLPEFLSVEKAVKSGINLQDLLIKNITYGHTPLGGKNTYTNEGVLFIRSGQLNDFFLDLTDDVYISENTHRKMQRSIIKGRDVLVATVGATIGAVAITPENIKEANCNQAVGILRSDEKKLNPYYLAIYLLSPYGKEQILRQSSGGARDNLDPFELKRVKIVLPSIKDQQKVEQVVKEAFQLKKDAEADYQKSRHLLNEVLGLTGVEKERELAFWRWSDEIDIVARIDPDYYRKGYTQLAKAKSVKLEPLSKFVVGYSGGYTFETEKYLPNGIPIIRIKDLNYPEVKKPEDAFFADLPELQRFTAKPDDILISMSGTVGLSAIIPKGLPKCYVNQRITAITTRGIDKFYLLAFLNSSFYREELEKIGTGGVQTNVSYQQIVSLPIPRLGNKEETISNLLRGFIEKNKESKQKLQEAKDFVENLVKKSSL